MKPDTILATVPDKTGKPVEFRISNYEKMITKRDDAKKEIGQMVYYRFYGRYLKPFCFADPQYRKSYKNGFAMMASSCLLIEALESFYLGLEETPKGENSEMFDSFFKREPAFKVFRGVKFYKNIRCGILHQGETTGGFALTRLEAAPLFDPQHKKINAYKFLTELEKSLAAYRDNLIRAEWDSEIWDNFRRKMRFIIKNCEN
jgi:hypothetical protein